MSGQEATMAIMRRNGTRQDAFAGQTSVNIRDKHLSGVGDRLLNAMGFRGVHQFAIDFPLFARTRGASRSI